MFAVTRGLGRLHGVTSANFAARFFITAKLLTHCLCVVVFGSWFGDEEDSAIIAALIAMRPVTCDRANQVFRSSVERKKTYSGNNCDRNDCFHG